MEYSPLFGCDATKVEYLRIYQPDWDPIRNQAKYFWHEVSKKIPHNKVRRFCLDVQKQKQPDPGFFSSLMSNHSSHKHLYPVIVITSPEPKILCENITADDFMDLSQRNGSCQFFLVYDMSEPAKERARRWVGWCKNIGLAILIVATMTRGSRCRLGRM